MLPETTKLRQKNFLNHIIEQEHWAIKRLTNAGIGFKPFNTPRQTLKGFEAMNMIHTQASKRNRTKGQCESSQVYCWNLRSDCLTKGKPDW
jgi:transposase-like protein